MKNYEYNMVSGYKSHLPHVLCNKYNKPKHPPPLQYNLRLDAISCIEALFAVCPVIRTICPYDIPI